VLAADLAYSLDPSLYAREVLRWNPDPHQERVLRWRSPRGLLCCTRQFGKSTTAAAAAVHETRYGTAPVVVIAAPAGRQTKELGLKIESLLDRAKLLIQRRDDELGLLLRNGARIVMLPGREASIRGVSGCTLLLVDEAARVPDPLYKALRPMLATTGGRTLLMSTPFGKRGFFYDCMGRPGWERLVVRATECDRIAPAFLAMEREELGDVWFRQEYLCEFLDTSTGMFSHQMILDTVDAELEPYKL
jgi:hypothetical protein